VQWLFRRLHKWDKGALSCAIFAFYLALQTPGTRSRRKVVSSSRLGLGRLPGRQRQPVFEAGSLKRTRRQKTPDRRGTLSTGRALVLAALLAGATATVYVFGLAGRRAVGGDHPWFFALVAIGVWAAFVRPVPVRNRRYSVSMALSEISALVATVFLSPLLALLAVSTGHLAAGAQRRVQPIKILTNWLIYAASAAIGILVYDELIGSGIPTSPHGWVVSGVAIAAVNAVNAALLLSVMATVDPRWRHPAVKPILVQTSLGVVLCTLGGLVAVSLIWVNNWGVLLFVAVAGAAVLAYREAAVASQRYTSLERLYGFTRNLSSLIEAPAVIGTVLEEARALLSANHAELVFPMGARIGATVGGGADKGVALHCTLVDEGEPEIEPQAEPSPLDKIAFERGAMRFSEGTQRSAEVDGDGRQRSSEVDGELGKALREHGLREGLVAPLQHDDPSAGYLLVADRAFRHDGFSDRELRFLEVLAANAGVSLRSTRLLEALRLEAEVRQHQAQHDSLTSLPNRSFLSERLEQALDGKDAKGSVAVMLVDLDGFKEVNDTLGHQTGDAILTEVAHRLAPLARGGDVVARLGGDEFAVLMPNAPSEAAISSKADEVLDLIRRPLAVEGLVLDVRASLGVAVSPSHSHDATALMRHADIAMYTAKRSGGGARFYDRAADQSTLRRLMIATELRRAVEVGDLEVWYQPVVELSSGKVVSCEALLRWDHDRFGPISPNEFIPVAESAGLIDQLTWWVLDTALSQAKAWRELVVPSLHMAVNFSARSLMSMDIAERLGEVLDQAGLEPGTLTLELTESSAMADPQGSLRVLSRLRRLGITLSIDDYGTGFSSLSRLKHLPFHELKIDRSFVKEIMHDKGDEAIVRSTIELARSLGRSVTAEGVEDQATLAHLEGLGCDAAQGFFLARPLPAPQCEKWLLAASAAGYGSVTRLHLDRRATDAGASPQSEPKPERASAPRRATGH
jgi:diguanylate cyclase (GGDEF)-like protein